MILLKFSRSVLDPAFPTPLTPKIDSFSVLTLSHRTHTPHAHQRNAATSSCTRLNVSAVENNYECMRIPCGLRSERAPVHTIGPSVCDPCPVRTWRTQSRGGPARSTLPTLREHARKWRSSPSCRRVGSRAALCAVLWSAQLRGHGLPAGHRPAAVLNVAAS